MSNKADFIEELRKGIESSLVDRKVEASTSFQPKLLTNNFKHGKKVLPFIEKELLNCDEFYISVAFITRSGIEPLLLTLKELERKGIKGKILTTDYLYFSDPSALEKLNEFSNIELKMFMTGSTNGGFHTKGYIFKETGIYKIIIGSSNLTGDALTRNREWNSLLTSTFNGSYTDEVLNEFEELWYSPNSAVFNVFFDAYKTQFYKLKSFKIREKEFQKHLQNVNYEVHRIEPNIMQKRFLSNISKLRNSGESRALLISATGTGKTYAAAFAVRDISPKRMLFLVHREQIARKAEESFKRICGSGHTYGVISGTSKEYEKDYVFATVWTIAKEESLKYYNQSSFDVIVIDEAHHSAAETYRRIMAYFKPKLWLGMTGSPDRTDGQDIYSIFHYNIAGEIRLPQAMEEDMLCPFHYFGITDSTFDDINNKFQNNDERDIHSLLTEERINNIVKNARFYGYSGERVKGLIFVSRKDEGILLSQTLNDRYQLKTVFLSGDDSQEVRESAIVRLTSDNCVDYLDYIITVNIFNEGIDIPEINQVLFLRPTESPIVFVQQLGRGLRKADEKEFVVILDFIGNYQNNYMIPIALSGDRSYNKDTVRNYLREGNSLIPGGSTIHFDEISRERIFKSLNDFSPDAVFLKEKYLELRNKLNRIPTILDFYDYGEIDPSLFFINRGKIKSYYNYVKKTEGNNANITFTSSQQRILEYVSQLLLNGKRIEELAIIRLLLNNKEISRNNVEETVHDYNPTYCFNKERFISAVRILKNKYLKEADRLQTYGNISILDQNIKLMASNLFKIACLDGYFRQEISMLVEYGFRIYRDNFSRQDQYGFVLYKKYFRKDVSRLLNWDSDLSSVMYGYKTYQGYCPIFVTYKKRRNISKAIQYNDHFLKNDIFSWMSRHNTKETDKQLQEIINSETNNMILLLFVMKEDNEGKDHYYFGRVHYLSHTQTTTTTDSGDVEPIVNFIFKLDVPVRDDMYDYFTAGANEFEKE